MLVLLVKAALTSSSAFFIEAAAKTVMVLSCASAGVSGLASPMPSATAARNIRIRSSILALLETPGAPARSRAALRQDDPATGLSGSDQPGSAVPGQRRAYGAPWAATQP